MDTTQEYKLVFSSERTDKKRHHAEVLQTAGKQKQRVQNKAIRLLRRRMGGSIETTPEDLQEDRRKKHSVKGAPIRDNCYPYGKLSAGRYREQAEVLIRY